MRAVSEPIPVRSVFSAMKVREENCNMVLLAAVALVSAMVALAANWWDRPQAAATGSAAYRDAQGSVRLVGAPFVPNVDPRARQ
jgi:hypothetical protein